MGKEPAWRGRGARVVVVGSVAEPGVHPVEPPCLCGTPKTVLENIVNVCHSEINTVKSVLLLYECIPTI